MSLPPFFTLDQARATGLTKKAVYELERTGQLERVGRGVYARPDATDPSLIGLAAAGVTQPLATLCLTSALVHHGLSDAIPFGTDIALPRGVRVPAGIRHVTWHRFDPDTFDLGRTTFSASELTLAVYSPARTIVDCFRMSHLEGIDVARTALRRWLPRRGSSPSALVQLAEQIPQAEPRIRQALEALL